MTDRDREPRVSDERLAQMCAWMENGNMLEGLPGVLDDAIDDLALDLRDCRADIAAARAEGEAAGFERGVRENALAVLLEINAAAEADMLSGNPVTGAHHRAIERKMEAIRALLPTPEETA